MTDLYALVDQLVATGGVSASRVCRMLSVGRAGFYRWRRTVESRRRERDEQLKPMIKQTFWRHKRRYGARRIVAELAVSDIACGVARVARLLKELQLKAIQPKSYAPRTTESRHRLGYNTNRLANGKKTFAVDQVWVADITYLALREGRFAYLSVLMDLWSRRVVGWSLDNTMAESLVLESLGHAIRDRQPPVGLIHHSDRGGQYAGKKYRAVLRRAGIEQSMSEAGNCYDNAFMESFFGSMKTELQLVDYADLAETLREITEYVRYYNFERRHSSLNMLSPFEFEQTAAIQIPVPVN